MIAVAQLRLDTHMVRIALLALSLICGPVLVIDLLLNTVKYNHIPKTDPANWVDQRYP